MEQGGVSFLRMAAGDPTSRLFPSQAAGAAELPTTRFREGRDVGFRIRGLGNRSLRGSLRRRRTRTGLDRRQTRRFCR